MKDKIHAIATHIYGADGVVYSGPAQKALENIEALGYANLPICVLKTQYSLSDDPILLGRPHGFTVTVRDLRCRQGPVSLYPSWAVFLLCQVYRGGRRHLISILMKSYLRPV